MELLHIPAVDYLFNAFDNQLRLVGGCVRDKLLNIPTDDIDMATPLTPDEMENVFKTHQIRYIETGKKHGTLTAIIDGKPYEITTLRHDKKTDGRHADVVFTVSYEQDALRRDFTINALYMDKNGTIYDYTDGRMDLQNKYVRFIGNPIDRITEDYLRILRYFRFWGKLGHHAIDEAALEACTKLAVGLKPLSIERKTAELIKILSAPNCSKTLDLMQKCGVLKYVLIADTEALKAFETICPNSNALQRLSILTHGNIPSLCLSNAQKKELEKLKEPVVFSKNTSENILILAKSDSETFNFFVSRALSEQKISPQQATELFHLKRPVFPLTPSDFLNAGIPQGPQIKHFLDLAYRIWANENFTNDKKLVLNRVLEYTEEK